MAGGAPEPRRARRVDRALAGGARRLDEKWLVTKGKLDYGPFSLADVVKQIEKGDIVAGNIIMDKDTGARVDVDEHPLLGPMVEAARQRATTPAARRPRSSSRAARRSAA